VKEKSSLVNYITVHLVLKQCLTGRIRCFHDLPYFNKIVKEKSSLLGYIVVHLIC
jgi:hypothetical protein